MRICERHLALPFGVVGGGGADEIDCSIHHEWNSIGRRHWKRLNDDIGDVEFTLNRVHDFQADIDGISDHLLIAIQIAERYRGFLDAEDDFVRLLDLLERSAQFGCVGRDGHQGGCNQDRWQAHRAYSLDIGSWCEGRSARRKTECMGPAWS